MSSTTLKSTSIDDRDGNVTYVPDRWTVHTNVESIYHLYDNTDTFSDIQNATATVRFYGDAIEYWGNQGPYHGPCLISVDGQEMTTINSHATADGYPIILYSKNNLSLGNHELQIRVVNLSYPNVCEVDRFVVNVTSTTGDNGGSSGNGNSGGGTGTSNNPSATNVRPKSGPPIGIIAGAAGAALALLLIVLLWMWLRRRSRRNRTAREKISKPVFVDDDLSYRVPPSFSQDVLYTSLLTPSQDPPPSHFTPSTNTFVHLPPGAAIANYYPHASPPTSDVQTTLNLSSHASTSLTATSYSTVQRTSSSIRNDHEHSTAPQHAAHVRNLNHLATEQSRPSAASHTPSPLMPPSSQSQPHASYLEKEREAFSGGNSSASGSGGSSTGRYTQPIILSPDVEPEHPPPAYEG